MKSKGMLMFVISIFTVLLILSGCSNRPSLDLVSSTVELRNDKERLGEIIITSEENEREFIVPIALSYDFILKNTDEKTLGKSKNINGLILPSDDGIKIYIEPSEKLKAVSKEVMGINIYDGEGNLGMGKSNLTVLEPNQEGKYSLDFMLGALEENPDIKLAPSSEQLEKLKEQAMDATLIVSVEGVEIARFDLSNSK